MKMRFTYPVELEPDEGGHFLVRFPDIDWALTGGLGKKEALDEAEDCLEEALAICIKQKLPIPTPSPACGRPMVSPGTLIAAKCALYESMQEKKLSNVALAKILGCTESEIRRMLSPKHATKIKRLEEAIEKMGKRLVLTVIAA